MTDTPNTQAPAVPSFAVVHTPVGMGQYAQQWQPVHAVDFYREPATNQQLERIRLETVE